MASFYHDTKSSQEREYNSEEALIPDSEKEERHPYEDLPFRKRRHIWPWVLHGLLFTFYTATYLAAFKFRGTHCSPNSLAYSPANEAVKYVKVSYHGGLEEINPYRGDPRPELDEAWHNLLEHNNVRISKDELKKMNRTAIELHDGSGYFGQISAYHHLHCLKFIRQVLHPDYYPTNTTDRDEHVDHCIDDIRQALMCNADTSIVTFDWRRPDWRRPWPNFNVDHTCVDWDTLDAWAAERSFSVYDQHTVVHPQLGVIFPLVDGKYEDISHGPGMHIVWPGDKL